MERTPCNPTRSSASNLTYRGNNHHRCLTGHQPKGGKCPFPSELPYRSHGQTGTYLLSARISEGGQIIFLAHRLPGTNQRRAPTSNVELLVSQGLFRHGRRDSRYGHHGAAAETLDGGRAGGRIARPMLTMPRRFPNRGFRWAA